MTDVKIKNDFDIGKITTSEMKRLFDDHEPVKGLVESGNAVIYCCDICEGHVHIGDYRQSGKDLVTEVNGWLNMKAKEVLGNCEGARLYFEVQEEAEELDETIEAKVFDPEESPRVSDRYYLSLVEKDHSVILRIVDSDGNLAPAGNLLILDKNEGRFERAVAVSHTTAEKAGLSTELDPADRIPIRDINV